MSSGRIRSRWRDASWRNIAGLAAMVAIAYAPALATARGVMPADTKLYLSLDPGRLLSAASSLWDNSQFGGWVTHQTIGYLWPTGPWYWLLEHLGLPPWVVQRLWIGTLFLAAGTGVWWCARRLGLGRRGAWVGGVVYQLSPYVLAYVSRTSVLLSPWAGLGWLVGFTVLAGRRGGWRYPALFALVVATVGGINATAVALIAVAPVLWLAHATMVTHDLPGRRAWAVAGKIGGLSLVVSLWWLVPLLLQSHYGADVLAYSETVSAVSSTSLASEVGRGLGYWLFYGGDITGRWTSASTPYLQSPGLIGLGFGLAAIGLAGVLFVRWRQRFFLAGLIVAGTVLAVGAHGASPLARALHGSARSTLVLALRSSTRAVPVLLLGLSLGIAALLTVWAPRWPRGTLAATAAVGALAVVNLPALYTGGLVDATLRHPQDMPTWWQQAADAASAGPPGYRVLELPGAEFAAHRWGITVDPVLPGLTDRPTIARDLLPLGSPALMDLLYALDDRFQNGVAERSEVAPVARLLGADDILFRGDVAFDKYQTPRPGETWAFYTDHSSGNASGDGAADGLGRPSTFGPIQPNVPQVAMEDETALSSPTANQGVPQLALVPVEDPQPIVRAADGRRAVVLAGSGAGVVDAAAAGLIDGTELLMYSADLGSTDRGSSASADGSSTTGGVPAGSALIVTDSNRKQAHQWRGSQDVTGFTEDEGPGLLEQDEADHRLPVFGQTGGGPAEQTLGEQRGPIEATASAYGPPTSYRPEDRAYFAVDGDPTTAWSVGDQANVIGERLRLDLDQPRDLSSVRLVQLLQPENRHITEVRLRTAAGERTVALDGRSWTPAGQQVALPPGSSSWLEIDITDATGGHLANYAGVDPVGFSTVDLDGLHADEVVQTPTGLLHDLGASSLDHPLALVFTRDRVDARKRWRDDPEAALVRSFSLPTPRTFRLSGMVHLSPRAPDAVLERLAPSPGPEAVASTHLAGVPAAGGRAAVDGDPTTAWQTAFGPANGATITVSEPAAITVDHLDLQVVADGNHSVPTGLLLGNGRERRAVTLPAIADHAGSAPVDVPISFPALTGQRFTVTITGTRDVTTVDRESEEPVVLPIGVAELGLPRPRAARSAATTIDTGCRDDLLTLDGQPVPVRITGPISAALAGQALSFAACGTGAVTSIGAGDHLLRAAPGVETGLDLDRLVLTSAAGGAAASRGPLLPRATSGGPVAKLTSSDRTHRRVEVSGGNGPFWLILGEGLNQGWHATVDGRDLGPPRSVDGGVNGWNIARTGDGAVTVSLTWTPQRFVWAGLSLSAAGVVVCVILALARPRARAVVTAPSAGVPFPRAWREPAAGRRLAWRPLVLAAVGVSVLTAFVFHPLAAPVVALALLLAGRIPRARWLCALASIAMFAATAGFYVLRQWRTKPAPGFGWTSRFWPGHPFALAAVCFLAADVAVSLAARPARAAAPPPSAPNPPEARPSAPIPAASERE